MKIIKPLLLFLLVVIIGVGIGWLASRRAGAPLIPGLGEPANRKTGSSNAAGASPSLLNFGVQSQNTNAVALPTESDAAPESTNLDDKVGDIIGEDTDITNIVTELAELFPKLSSDGKLEAVEHLTNLVPDDNYGPLANILTNGTATPEVESHLLTDLIDRPNAIKMPLLLAVARDPHNPGAKEALDNLQLLIDPDEDPGEDWDKWQKAVDAWMKDNPD